MYTLRVSFLISALFALFAIALAEPDSDVVPTPGPGLAYGGIPYGSVSGNVADFFQRQAAPSGRSRGYVFGNNIDYAPIEQYL